MSDPVFVRPKKDSEFDPKRFLPRPLFESNEMPRRKPMRGCTPFPRSLSGSFSDTP